MIVTKREILNFAYSELGMAGYVFNLGAAEIADALHRMDSLAASWEALGLTFGYSFHDTLAANDPDDPMTIPDSAIRALRTNLAVDLAPIIGKTASPHTLHAARDSLNALRVQQMTIPQRQMPSNMPRGAGSMNGFTPCDTYFAPNDPLTANGQVIEVNP